MLRVAAASAIAAQAAAGGLTGTYMAQLGGRSMLLRRLLLQGRVRLDGNPRDLHFGVRTLDGDAR